VFECPVVYNGNPTQTTLLQGPAGQIWAGVNRATAICFGERHRRKENTQVSL